MTRTATANRLAPMGNQSHSDPTSPGFTRQYLTWTERFTQVARYVGDHHDYPPYHTRLGRWLTEQRHAYHKGRLAGQRRRTLETLPNWQWSLRDSSWEHHFACIAKLLVTTGGYPPSATRLGRWIEQQRKLRAAGKLPAERATKLETLPGWIWFRDRVGEWQVRLSELAHHIETTGEYPDRRAPLAAWERDQRRAHRKGSLSSDRVAQLESLPGWKWEPGKWSSQRAPQPYRRSPGIQATDALHAHTVLTDRRPANLSDAIYRTYLDVLDARMSDTTASLSELAAAMSPPMTKEAFAGHLRRGHAAAGIAFTRAERGVQ